MPQISISEAYKYCSKIALSHYENFPVGSILIPKKLRKHFFALYAFMRTADDFADLPSRTIEARLSLLTDWRKQLDNVLAGEKTENPIFLALGNTILECKLPTQPFYKLLEAFEFDAKGEVKFETFDDLRWYTARSAEPVGELVLALFGYKEEERIRLSNDICSGLQVLNFIQDIREDFINNRYYYPQEDCRKFRLTGGSDGLKSVLLNKISLFELERVEFLLNNGASLAESVRGRLRYELRAVILAARKMISKIRKVDGDTYSQRPKLSRREHIVILLQSMFFSVDIRWSKHKLR